jgi:hypothetical protein
MSIAPATAPNRFVVFYIDSGAKNAMFTLRISRINGNYCSDNYVCNLATDADRAAAKGREYFERVIGRDGFEAGSVSFGGRPDFNLYERRARLSVRDTESLLAIESGYFPFGKHSGESFAAAPDSYVLWWADKAGLVNETPVANAIAIACMGAACDRDLIAKRQIIRDEQKAIDAESDFVGTVGTPVIVQGEVILCLFKASYLGDYYITKIRDRNKNLFTYFGKHIAAKGSPITATFTVKAHDTYQGTRSTLVNRPRKVTAA